MNKRDFVRSRRKGLKLLKEGLSDVRFGSAITKIYGADTDVIGAALYDIAKAVRTIDAITKEIAK